MDAERIDVLHRADGDARVVGVAHHLVLDLLPADEALLDHDLADRAGPQPGPDPLAVGGLGLDDAAAGAAERERRADDGRQADRRERLVGRGVALRLGRALDDEARGVGLADPVEQVAERLAVLGHPDRLERRAEEADGVAFEDARVGHRGDEVERCLAAQPGEEPLGLFLGDDRLDRLDRQRLEVDDVGDRGVGHDRGRVRVDEDRPDALGPQRAAGLGAGVVEFGRLADDDRPRSEDQDRRRLQAWRRQRPAPRAAVAAATNRSNTASASSGPGAPSGWYWTVSIGFSRWRRPSTEPSLRLTWLTRNPDALGSDAPTTWTSWFWAVTWTRPELDVVDRMVRPVVSEPEPGRVRARRPTDDLVAEADAEQRPAVVDDRLRQGHGAVESSRIPRARRQDQAVDVRSEGDSGRDRVRQDADPGAAVAHGADDVGLQSEVDDPDQRAAVLRTTDVHDRRRRDVADEVLVLPARNGPRRRNGRVAVGLAGCGDDASQAAVRPQVTGEGAGVDAGDGRDVVRRAAARPAGARRRGRPPSRWRRPAPRSHGRIDWSSSARRP